MAEKAQRNQEIIKFYVAGISQAEISRQFDVNRSTISRILKKASEQIV